MTSAANLIDKVKKAQNWTSDYQCAKGLGITTQAISKIRAGGGIGNDLAWKIAEILNEEPAAIIAEAEAERAEKAGDMERAKLWGSRFRQVARHAASLSIFGIALTYGQSVIERLCILC